ncbi:GntR family transcriptional regulator [Actinokineospora alba]|uniref:GntR family transcriptional regulator n=1 Tax=Actinokineospora alba TaxID=504798 RepID=A0A1H0ENL9_9PSEU|nr:GntR family transcriptional regulator [Actinokineospora alba]TDP69155.1 GntR family transcriptional regulator [Actinokineospora alba]SDI23149.1 GntR family transcriptional regulator [Actinokineospora alba]SDN83972.1 GntR family transcriptional regulator [Actinokineospora alba]
MGTPLHEQIAAEVRRQIATGELAVGAQVPSESQLCALWDASRGPVRQALATLRAEGLIGGGRGKPPVVRRQALSQPFDTFLSFSRWVDGLGRSAGQRTLEVALRPAPAEVADPLHIDEGTPVVQLVRLRLIDDKPTMVERSTFVESAGRLLFDFDCDSGSIYAYLAGRGVDITVAHHLIDAVAADETDSDLLGVALGAPLLRERRLARGSGGEEIEYSDDRYRPDMISFTIENSLQAAQPALVRSLRPATEQKKSAS